MQDAVRFFGFDKHPFTLTPDYSFFFLSKKHAEIAKGISTGVLQQRGVFMLTGEVGTGKTFTSRVLVEKLSKHFYVAYILNPFLSPDGLVRNIAEEFGISPIPERLDALITKLHFFLIEAMKSGKGAVVFIDEAQHLSDVSLEMLRVLSNLETNNKKLLQFVLVGQKELIDKLSKRHLRQLAQRVAIKYELGPLSLAETHDYIFHRIKQAGGLGKVEFNRLAILQVHRLTKGYPRSINILLDNVFNIAAQKQKKVIDIKTINAGFKNMLPFPLRFLPIYLFRGIKL